MSNINNNRLNCSQINLQRSKNATTNLLKYIEDNRIDLVIIQEPYTIKNKVCGLPMRAKVFYDQICNRPKTAVFVPNRDLQIVFIQSFSNAFLTTVNIELLQKSVIVFGLYLSPLEDIRIGLDFLQTAINTLKPTYYIICADSNAHSHVWFDSHNDERGDILLDFISKNNNLIVNNNETSPMFESKNGKSSIDITLTSIALNNYINQWFIDESESLSDHKYIRFNISGQIKPLLQKNTFIFST
jgi:hypothetical protein